MPAGPKAEAARQILVAVNGAPTSIRVGVYLCVPTNPPKQLAHATAHELWTNKPCIEYWCRDKPVQFAFPDPVKEALDVAQSDPPNLGQRLCYAFITILYYLLRDKKLHEFNALRDAAAVTHRIPYGGKFVEHQLVISPDDTIFDYLHDYAPEDNPAHLALVLETFRQCRGVKQLLCFDTIYPASGSTTRPGDIIAQNTIAQSGGFNSFIDPDVQNTPGLHGVSYVGVLEQVSKYMRIDANRLNLIVCHLGNTSSVGVIQYGKCISFKKDFIGAKRASKNQIMWAMEEMSRAPHKVHGNSLKAVRPQPCTISFLNTISMSPFISLASLLHLTSLTHCRHYIYFVAAVCSGSSHILMLVSNLRSLLLCMAILLISSCSSLTR